MGFTHSRITYSKNTVAHWRNPVNYIFPKLVLFVCFFFHWEFKLNEKPGPLPFAVSDNLYAQFLLFVAFLVYSHTINKKLEQTRKCRRSNYGGELQVKAEISCFTYL